MADGYSRSAKVGFSIVAKNLEDLTKTNDLFDSLIKKGKKADSILSNLGSHNSDSGLSKFKDGLSGVNDQLDKITDKSKDFASTMNGHLKSVADDSNKTAGRMSSAFSKATDKIKHGMDNISDNKEIKFKTNASQLQRDFKKAQYQTDKTKDSLSSMRNQLDRNNNSIKLASREHDSYINALKSEGNYTKASREELKGLITSYSQLSKQLDKEKNYLVKVRNATGKTSDAYMKQSTIVNELRSHVANTKDEMARMNVTADRSHTAFGRLYNAGSKLSNMGTTVAMAMIPVAAAFKKSADEATNLQNRYITIKNLLNTGGESSNAAKAETKAMQKENNRFALQYGVSPTAMAKGGEELIRRGYNGRQELASHKYFLQAARASGNPYNAVVNYGAPTLEQFGYKTKAGNSRRKMIAYTKKVLNEMAYGSDLTATNFEGMGNALRYVGSTAHSSNQGLARTVAGIGVLSNNGQDGSIAGTGLRKVMNSFAAPNMKSKQGKVMSALGIKPSDFQKANGQVKNLADNMDVLKKVTAGMSSAQKFNVFHMFFGTTGQESGLILANNTKQLRSLTRQVSRAQQYGKNGYISSLAKKNMASWKNQIDLFKQYINIMGMGFTKTVLPAFTNALNIANKFLGVLIKLPLPIKKAAGYATAFASVWGGIKVGKGLLGLSTSLLFGKGHKASTASGALSTVEDVTGASPLAGSQISREEKASATRTHFAQSRLGNAATAMSSDRLLKGMSYATVGLQIGSHAVSAFKHGIDSKQGGSQMWQAGGNAVGAGLGAALSGGNPLVMMIGSSVGGSIAKTFSNSKFVKNARVGYSRMKNSQSSSTTGYGDRQNSAEKRIIHHPGYNTDVYGLEVPNNHQSSSHKNTPSLGLDKYGKKELKSFTSSFKKANANWATVSKGTGSKINQNVYGSMRKGLKSYTSSEKSSSNKRVQWLLKEGVITKKQANSMEKSDSKYWNKRYSNASKGISKINRSERNGGKGREAAISASDRAISKLLTNNANKETIIYGRLKDRTSKLSQQQARSIIRSSYKTMNSTISSANKTYKATKKSANDKYQSTKSALDKELYVTHSITERQYKQEVKKARQKRDDTVKAAHQTRDRTIDSAEAMHEKVIQKTSAMVKGNLKQMNTWTGSIKSIWSKFGDWWGNLWGGLTKLGHLGTKAMASNLANGLKQNNSLLTQMKNGKKHPSKSKRTASKDANKLPGNVFAAHALGSSSSTHAHTALVGEGGLELAYTVNGRHARILGANGPEITHVKHGERILNHRDTKKVLSGSYGRVLPGYATGNTKLGGKRAKSDIDRLSKKSSRVWSKVSRTTSKHTKYIKKKTVSDYDALQKGSYKQLSQFDKGNTSKWRKITSNTKHYTNQSKNQAISTYDSMQKGVQKQMDQLHSGVVNSAKGTAKGFGSALGKMDNYAHSAMSNTVHQLNGGIKGIDKVLNQFGGNSSVINTIHYATGSNGALTRNQLAMVNDAGYGSQQEAIVHHGNVILPSGHNRMMALQKGDQVLNGLQTQKLASMYGLSHFAKGSGVSDSALRKIAKNNADNPNKAFNTSFTINLKENGHALQNGTTGMAKGGSTKYGDQWSSAMWSYIEGLIQAGGTGSGTKGKFLQEAIKLGKSAHLRYSEAANLRLGPNAYDCSGLVYESLKRLGITLPGSTTGSEYAATKSVPWSKGEPGDLAFYNGHVGIVSSTAGGGRMWNAANPTDGIKYDPIKGFGGGFKGLRTVPGLSDKSSKKKNSTSSLQKLVKKELGSKAIAWIKKHLQVSLGDVGSLALGGDIASRARALASAIKKAYPAATNKGIAAVLGNWEFESGLNPTAVNSGGGASGLGQWLGGRLSGLKSYASRHGKSWKNAGVQLDFALHDDSSNSSILKRVLRGSGSVSSLANEFSSSWERGGHNAQHVAGARKVAAALSKNANGGWAKSASIFGEKNGEPEVAINPKRSSADRLLMQAIAKRIREAPSSIFGKLFNSSKRQKEIEDIKKFSPASFKIAPTSKKPAKVTEQKAVFSPNITVNVNVSSSATAKKVGNEVAKQVEDIVQRMFKKEYNITETGTL